MKKLNKFLSLILLLSATTSQVAFCMQQKDSVEILGSQIENSFDQDSTPNPVKNGLMSEEDRIREFEKEEQRKRNSFKEIDQNVLKDIIFEYLELNDLKKISESCNSLNKLFKEYMEDPTQSSKIQITTTIDLDSLNFLTKSNDKFKKIQEKILKFINRSDRSTVINFKPPFGIRGGYMPFDTKTYRRTAIKRYPSIIIDKNNIDLLKTNLLDNIISRKDIAKSEAKKNKAAIAASVGVTAGIAITFAFHYRSNMQISKKIDRFIFGEKLYKKITHPIADRAMREISALTFAGLLGLIASEEIDRL